MELNFRYITQSIQLKDYRQAWPGLTRFDLGELNFRYITQSIQLKDYRLALFEAFPLG